MRDWIAFRSAGVVAHAARVLRPSSSRKRRPRGRSSASTSSLRVVSRALLLEQDGRDALADLLEARRCRTRSMTPTGEASMHHHAQAAAALPARAESSVRCSWYDGDRASSSWRRSSTAMSTGGAGWRPWPRGTPSSRTATSSASGLGCPPRSRRAPILLRQLDQRLQQAALDAVVREAAPARRRTSGSRAPSPRGLQAGVAGAWCVVDGDLEALLLEAAGHALVALRRSSIEKPPVISSTERRRAPRPCASTWRTKARPRPRRPAGRASTCSGRA
mgnify:CR=1 FL=1